MRKHRGFTLIELMIVIAIIAIIAAIAIPNLLEARKSANESNAVQALRSVHTAQTLFRDRDWDRDGRGDYADGFNELRGLLPDSLTGTGNDDRIYAGYLFGLVGPMNGDRRIEWGCVGAPVRMGKTGDRSFYIDESGVIRFSTTFNIDQGTQNVEFFTEIGAAWTELGK